MAACFTSTLSARPGTKSNQVGARSMSAKEAVEYGIVDEVIPLADK